MPHPDEEVRASFNVSMDNPLYERLHHIGLNGDRVLLQVEDRFIEGMVVEERLEVDSMQATFGFIGKVTS